ncbi:MAG TPA: nicotinate phosphoribosyltransferase [Bryobacteraceae bacterium]|jgi:nicotinate phosphoribosyltransferase|nr:nicotinate phosphoribosyltransferase [Bryobacteraceae bacterium]
MNGLLTDLYELTMAAGYYEAGKARQKATFELTIRRLPAHRNYVIAAGLPQAIDYLLNLSFTTEEIDYLRGLPAFANASAGFFDYLRGFRFTGDVFAVPEGTPLFTGEPMMIVRAPIIEAQIPETYLLSTLTFQTLIASKAARMVDAASGREVVEFGTRRAHTPEAGVLAGRAAYIGGCVGTSNALAGMRYGVPVYGTAAHSWVLSFCGENEAFRKLQQILGPSTVQLVDTYDTIAGVKKVAAIGPPLWGIRLDSGDFDRLSREARAVLDQAGLTDAKIMLSGDLDEYAISNLVSSGAPVDAFGVGTQLATSADAPAMGTIYKLVELDVGCGIKRFTAKLSQDKTTVPGAKQLFRFADHDILARSGECSNGQAMLRPVLLDGTLVEPLPDLNAARARRADSLAKLPAALHSLDPAEPWPIRHSKDLAALIERTRSNIV